jgi:hypothetical protein
LNFLADMGERPSIETDIHRKDSDGNYEPGNCEWKGRSSHRSQHVNERGIN